MEAILSNKVYCIGCGVEIQSEDQNKQGYLPKSVVEKSIDGNLVCSISLRLPWGNNPGPYGVPHIGWLATHPDYKKQGLAVELIKWAEENILLKQLKVPFVTLGTAENHPWLNSFYIKQGFEDLQRDLRLPHNNNGRL